MQLVHEEIELYRQRIAELEDELEEMTAAVSHAWDQLVPFLQETPQQASSPIDIIPIIQAAMAAADTDMGGVYLFQNDEWLAYPEHINLPPQLRERLKTLSEPGATLQWQSDTHSSHNVSWFFAAVVAEHQVIGSIGVGSGDASRTFNTVDLRIITRMAERAASQIVAAQLAESREREAAVQHELQIANMIQRSNQPLHPPQIPNMEVAYFWNPAKQVGGDAWGWVTQPDGRLAWFILDIAGKGLPAALAAMSLHTAIRIGLRMGLTPVALMKIINEEFYDVYTRTDLMATVSIVSLEPETGVLEQANAGHPPTLVKQGGAWYSLKATAPPIGVLPDIEIELQQLKLEKDDLIICYSDGFSEIETASGLWGEEGLLSAIPTGISSAEVLLKHMVEAAAKTSLQPEIRDDQTLVVVTRK